MNDILIRRYGGGWTEPQNHVYGNEDELQALLSAHPQLIPGVGLGAKTRREFQSEVGPADIVVVEPNGAITLVECKLAKNREVRREIIGQLFDYAGRLWQMDVEQFEERWSRGGQSPLFSGEGFDDPDLKEVVAGNLASGQFTLVLAVDAINPDLKRMVEYLNGITRSETSVIAVEYIRYLDGEVEVLTPRTYGQDLAEAKAVRRSGSQRTWTLEDYVSWLVDNEPSSVELFNQLADGLFSASMVFQGGRGKNPSGSFVLEMGDGILVQPLRVSFIGHAILELNFEWVPTSVRQGSALLAMERLKKAWLAIPALTEAMKTIVAVDQKTRRKEIVLASVDSSSIEAIVRAVKDFAS